MLPNESKRVKKFFDRCLCCRQRSVTLIRRGPRRSSSRRSRMMLSVISTAGSSRSAALWRRNNRGLGPGLRRHPIQGPDLPGSSLGRLRSGWFRRRPSQLDAAGGRGLPRLGCMVRPWRGRGRGGCDRFPDRDVLVNFLACGAALFGTRRTFLLKRGRGRGGGTALGDDIANFLYPMIKKGRWSRRGAGVDHRAMDRLGRKPIRPDHFFGCRIQAGACRRNRRRTDRHPPGPNGIFGRNKPFFLRLSGDESTPGHHDRRPRDMIVDEVDIDIHGTAGTVIVNLARSERHPAHPVRPIKKSNTAGRPNSQSRTRYPDPPHGS